MTLKLQRLILHMIQHTNNYQAYQNFKISDFKQTLLPNPLNLASERGWLSKTTTILQETPVIFTRLTFYGNKDSTCLKLSGV